MLVLSNFREENFPILYDLLLSVKNEHQEQRVLQRSPDNVGIV